MAILKLQRDVFTGSQKKVIAKLRLSRRQVSRAVGDAYFVYAIGIVTLAKERAPVETGELVSSAFVDAPEVKGPIIIIKAGFKAVHSRMRDVGTSFLPGGVLRPIRAEALFIPLREGALPNDPNLKFGIDFVLAKQVRQEGTRYWSATLEEQLPQMSRIVGRTAFGILKRRGGSGR